MTPREMRRIRASPRSHRLERLFQRMSDPNPGSSAGLKSVADRWRHRCQIHELHRGQEERSGSDC